MAKPRHPMTGRGERLIEGGPSATTARTWSPDQLAHVRVQQHAPNIKIKKCLFSEYGGVLENFAGIPPRGSLAPPSECVMYWTLVAPSSPPSPHIGKLR
jgi:hypothetical protein